MTPPAEQSSPLTFDLKEDLLAKIEAVRSRLGLASNSEVIRLAIGQFDFGAYEAPDVPHRQISVRLPLPMKEKLVRVSRKQDVSLGELLRTALEALPTKGAAAESMAKKSAKKAPAKKKAAKKAKK